MRNQPFHMEVDASNRAIGAVLSQIAEYGKRRLNGFYSAGLNNAQKKYAVGELEACAIVAVIRKLS